MKTLLNTLIVASLVGLTMSVLTQDQANSFVGLHNRFRGTVQPTASTMMALQYDASLATSAQARANACPVTHTGAPAGVGESIAWGWPQMAVSEAFDKWTAESSGYNYNSNQCTSGECGHFTQVVHDATKTFGCGHNTCSGSFGQSSVQTYVCHYVEAGNSVGSKPYVAGPSCSSCPASYTCIDQLCAMMDVTNTTLFPDTESSSTNSPSPVTNVLNNNTTASNGSQISTGSSGSPLFANNLSPSPSNSHSSEVSGGLAGTVASHLLRASTFNGLIGNGTANRNLFTMPTTGMSAVPVSAAGVGSPSIIGATVEQVNDTTLKWARFNRTVASHDDSLYANTSKQMYHKDDKSLYPSAGGNGPKAGNSGTTNAPLNKTKDGESC